MSTVPCPACWAANDASSAFCRECGTRLVRGTPGEGHPADDTVFPLLRNYPSWLLLSLGIALVILGVALFAIYGVVGAVLCSGLASGTRGACGNALFQYLFLLPGACVLILGLGLVAVTLYRALVAP